ERGAAEEAPAAISQEAPWSAAAELEGEAGARPLPEGQSLLGPLFNRLASVLSVGGNHSHSFLTNVIIYSSDAIFRGAFDFAFLLACLGRSWQGHGSDFISSFHSRTNLMLSTLSYKINSYEVFYWMERRFSHLASLCDLLLQHPNMPVLIHTSKRKSLQNPGHPRGSPTRKDDVKSTLPAVPLISRNLAQASKGSIETPGKRYAQTPTLTCVNPPKKPRLSPVQTTPESTPTADLGTFLNLPSPPSTAGHGPRVAARVSRKTPAQGQGFDLQPPPDRSPSRSVRAVSAAHPAPIIRVPGQPLRMLFLREGEGQWSCRYTAPPSPRPAERPAPPAQSPSVDQEPEGHTVPGPRSILYDDLQVSSSSEESDWDEDTSGN
ncbi:hypothetical protein Celaphus_00019219, partial [Cervus elaphus hippelaphus]